MQSIDNFLATIKALRSPGGCPWDRAQTHKTIRVNAAEECAELLEAIDLDSVPKMREELGDLLMIIALHCEIAAENNEFTFDDVVREIDQKIIRRHPHVFGDKTAANADEVLKIWQDAKKAEKKERDAFRKRRKKKPKRRHKRRRNRRNINSSFFVLNSIF